MFFFIFIDTGGKTRGSDLHETLLHFMQELKYGIAKENTRIAGTVEWEKTSVWFSIVCHANK